MNYLQTSLEMRIAQLQSENNSLLQKEVSDYFFLFKRLRIVDFEKLYIQIFNSISYVGWIGGKK